MSAAEELRDHLALALVPGLGPRLTAALLRHFGSAAAARRATADQLRQVPHIGAKLARQLATAFQQVDAAVAREEALMTQHGVRAVIWTEPEYPAPLLTISNPPPLLFLKGRWDSRDQRAVAVVGTRQATAAGRRWAEHLGRGLALAGYTVVSGLARGIDGAAHQAALDSGGRTIAVLAGGLGRIYPPEHEELARRIASGPGCLISETPMQTPPQPGMFPARNRLISGLSLAVVLVEAGARSGALITAQHALEQGREVFALPGNLDSEASAGCLALLRQGARLIRSVDDLLEDLHGLKVGKSAPSSSRPASLFAREPSSSRPASLFAEETSPGPPSAAPSPNGPPASPAPPASAASPLPASPSNRTPPAPPPPSSTASPPPLDPSLQAIWDQLGQRRHIDELAYALHCGVADLLPRLMQLELQHRIRRLPGNFYERTGH
jgi:DNA processing protein